jgi:hypothetical protein
MSNCQTSARRCVKVVADKPLTTGQSVASENPFPELAPSHRVDPMILWGAWPGEEPLEELMRLLD